ncbi:hypothetical protein [Streptomyces sp. NPDC086777]|uniref:hypothetical protein n=1 Tax=Streptomyces sp. NPDC086777 TaxID=3154866 RepID=UPI00344E99C6
MHPLARVKAFVSDLLLWSCFAGALAASSASGAVLDGTRKDIATYTGIGVSLLTGSRIAKKPRIKAFLARRGTLWFLFLFNGATAAALYVAMDGVQGITGAAFMGLVSLGAGGGLLASRRRPKPARARAADQPWT